MPKRTRSPGYRKPRAFRPTTLSELQAATRAECKRRFAEFAGREWSDELVGRDIFREMDEREKKARLVFAQLRDALWAAYDFVQEAKEEAGRRAWQGAPPEVVEQYRNAIGGDCASALKTIVDGILPCCHIAKALFAPMWQPEAPDAKTPLVPQWLFHREHRYEDNARPLTLDMEPRAALLEDIDPASFAKRPASQIPSWAFFETGRRPTNTELAVISILAGNFPQSVVVGRTTVAEVIEVETNTMRELRRRRNQAAGVLKFAEPGDAPVK